MNQWIRESTTCRILYECVDLKFLYLFNSNPISDRTLPKSWLEKLPYIRFDHKTFKQKIQECDLHSRIFNCRPFKLSGSLPAPQTAIGLEKKSG